jgi:hypothetical protein
VIYVASILEGAFVKIGFAKSNPAGRIACLQVGCPFLISLDFVVEGTQQQEGYFHNDNRLNSILSIGRSNSDAWWPVLLMNGIRANIRLYKVFLLSYASV